ncbi:MAG TPA: DUF1223 domain-containing protein [Verrucomicrobiae bacterium]|nr:DUF1223 domain-containing protein [Verrucomicrobiae bacterium]
MPRVLALAFLSFFSALATGETARAPVLVELFTSEGCSSCPPADRLLAELDPHAIVLGEHVDYWDRLGWRDRFSSAAFTERQENYGRKFRLESVYTPEMVVDGAAEFSGSDNRRAAEEIARASQRPKAKLRISRTSAGLEISVESAPRTADVYLALADKEATTQVGNGENKGRQLRHVSVARSLRKVGAVKKGGGFQKVVELPAGSERQRVIVFLQDGGSGDVAGAAMLESGQSTN